MKTKKSMLAVGMICGITAMPSFAQTWDLSTDFSLTSNPNGAWSYIQGGIPITSTLNESGWGYSDSYEGSITKGLSGIAGEILIHTLSFAYGGDTTLVGVKWTAPTSGEYTISGKAYDVGFSYFKGERNANWTLSIAGVLVAENISGVYGIASSDAGALFSNNLLQGKSLTELSLAAGDQITFITQTQMNTLSKTGSFMGVDVTVSSVPVPGAIWLFLTGFVGLLGLKRNRQ